MYPVNLLFKGGQTMPNIKQEIRAKGLLLKKACGLVLSVPLVMGASYSNAVSLEEIVVTAQKREESLQDTPIAITAFTSTALVDKGISDISELAQLTPNLVFDTASQIGGAANAAAIFIRGIGNTDFALTTDPGVGTYVDGVYISRSVGGVLDVLDVERIEILRGPQGTLFGRNTIGGAVSITTRRPAEELQGAIELTAGNEGRINVRASIDLPLSETVRTSFAMSSKQRDGYVRRVFDGAELGDEDKQSFRGTIYFEPNETWDFQLSADYSEADESSSAGIASGFTAGAGVLGYVESIGRNPFDQADVGQTIAELTSDFVSSIDNPVNYGNFAQFSTSEVKGVSLISNLNLGDHDIKYTVAYRETESAFSNDADGAPFPITDIQNLQYEHEQTSHEFQFTGSLLDNRFKYAAGLYYFEEQGTDTVQVPLLLPAFIGFPINGDNTTFVNNFATVDNESEAAYFQTTYDINDTFSTTFGIRSTEDTKTYGYAQFLGVNIIDGFPTTTPAGPFAPLIGNGIGSETKVFKETQYKFGVDATLENGTLLYYSYSEGFKSGGFVLRYVIPRAEPLSFNPETLISHEIGLKWQSSNDLYRLNAAVFSSEYEDIQVTLFDAGGGPVSANAGTADISGLELEFTAILSDSLQLELGYGYTDAEYTSLTDLSALGLSLGVTLDSELVNTPEHTASIGLEYTTELTGKDLVFRADYSYTSEIFNDSQNSQFLFQDDVSLLNISARLALTGQSDLVGYVENLTDERYIISGNSNFGLGFHSPVVSHPREVGVTYRHRF